MAEIPLDSAELIALVLQAIFYGLSVLMFGGTIWVLTAYRTATRGRLNMSIIAVVLLLLSTAHLITDVIRVNEGFVKYRNTFKGGPPGYFADVSQKAFVARSLIYALQTLVGDGVLIYRCYVIWQSPWIVIVPILGWCSSAVTGICAPYYVSVGAGEVFSPNTARWITAFYASTFATNTLTTALLAYRIWRISTSVSGNRALGRNLNHIVTVVLDAGLLYSATLLTVTITFVQKTRGERIVYAMLCPIISIVFYMVIIRCGTATTENRGLATMTCTNVDFATAPGTRTTAAATETQTHTHTRSASSHAMKPLEVHVTRMSDTSHAEGDQYRALGPDGELCRRPSREAADKVRSW